MTLGKPTQCWVCWESKAYEYREQGKGSFGDFKQACVPIKGKAGTMVANSLMWVCKNHIKN
ncbi:hypothetical protein LCGC14_2142200 [marine sediment metagenome]|uniref:Uncharacterized protein n=1 Tax=marine sediment metagenome TaxID=412755 RepID=A0A0F9DY98_9ZZZZ